MMKILIAYDGSEPSSIAIEDLSFAGLPSTGEAVILYAVEEDAIPYRSADETEILSTIVSRVLEEGVRLAKQVLPGYRITTEYRIEDPSEAILRKAEEWRPEMIVMGARAQSAMKKVVFGSVSQQVLTHATTSVRIGRFAETHHTSPRILIAIDGSRTSIQALQHVVKRCCPEGTKFRLVTVLTFSRLAAGSTLSMTIQELLESQMQQRIAWIMEQHRSDIDLLRSHNLEVSEVTLVGNPKQKILEEAMTWEADSIVLGSMLLSTLERLLIGSVSISVAKRASCSIEIIR